MAEPDTQVTTDPTEGQSQQPTVPAKSDAGQTQNQTTPNEDLPDKFKGKSAAEIAKAYSELEQLHGKNSNEVATYRRDIENWQALGKVIQSNPALYKAVSEEIAKLTTPSSQMEPSEVKPDDTRIAVVDTIVADFEKDSGITRLPDEERVKIQQAIGKEIAEMRDPTGKMTWQQAWDTIPVNQLRKYLDRARKLVMSEVGTDPEKIKLKAIIEAQQNNEAAMGNMNFSSVNESSTKLTDQEKEIARKMHISEKDYLKNKNELND